ncbi:MAG: rRNA maturation RNase YbeY [Coriobacteriales bacterium]|jgi:probable rRNA maturation factor|nr:rRNA maturation RNase YbeY [Coriobacteriales bacterium]
MEIGLDNRSATQLDLQYYRRLALFALSAEAAPESCELSVSFVEDDEMQALNRDYRSIDAPTDVLSFGIDDELLGDVVVSPAQARLHARDFSSSEAAEIDLLIVHGILHLLGYNHEDDAEAARMEARENLLLALWRQEEDRS